MFNIFLGVFFSTLAFAFVEPFFFIGYLISIALFGLFQAIFMANAGGAWDNAKKIVETELKMKGTPLHDASVVGDTVGDPFKDTSSVAMNPVIKFTTLFGAARGRARRLLSSQPARPLRSGCAAVFFVAEHGVRVPLVLRDADRGVRATREGSGSMPNRHGCAAQPTVDGAIRGRLESPGLAGTLVRTACSPPVGELDFRAAVREKR